MFDIGTQAVSLSPGNLVDLDVLTDGLSMCKDSGAGLGCPVQNLDQFLAQATW